MSSWGCWVYSLVCYTLIFILSWLQCFFSYYLFLTSSVVGLAGTNDIDWVSVLYFPGQEDLSYVFSGLKGEIQTIHSQASLVWGDKVLQFISWLSIVPTVWPCLPVILLSRFPISLAKEFS